jgi:ribosomal protein S18 acetylase RimI-like enzyme
VSKAIIRPAILQDLPAVEALWTQYASYHRELGLAFPGSEQDSAAWRASFERTLGRFSFVWVAEQDSVICAFLLARLKKTPAFLGGVMVGEINDLYVTESLRGQKVGSQLAEAAIENFRQQQVHSIEVQVLQRNLGGLAFWKALSFSPELTQLRLFIHSE